MVQQAKECSFDVKWWMKAVHPIDRLAGRRTRLDRGMLAVVVGAAEDAARYHRSASRGASNTLALGEYLDGATASGSGSASASASGSVKVDQRVSMVVDLNLGLGGEDAAVVVDAYSARAGGIVVAAAAVVVVDDARGVPCSSCPLRQRRRSSLKRSRQ